MKAQYVLICALLSTATLLHAQPTSPEHLGKPPSVPSAPLDAKGGTIKDGIEIGLWTQKETYTIDEFRNVWMFARKKQGSPYTVGVDGNIYETSFIYITDSAGKVTKLPVGGGIDGMVDPSAFFGGISESLKSLPVGSYSLVWKTKKLESNKIEITIK